MNFGQKLQKIRREKGISQQELARRLGYKTNSYVSDMEKGKFIPSQQKLREIAKALGLPFSKIKDSLLESKLEEMGIKEPALVSMLKDYPRFTSADKRAIIRVYFKIKERKAK
jgi:transcriptional regulator with XRE-family HTH domain